MVMRYENSRVISLGNRQVHICNMLTKSVKSNLKRTPGDGKSGISPIASDNRVIRSDSDIVSICTVKKHILHTHTHTHIEGAAKKRTKTKN